jgi:membrane protease YdiL (CAAX protease family)
LTVPLVRTAGGGQSALQPPRRQPVPWTFVDIFAGLGVVLLASLTLSAVLDFGSWTGGAGRLLLGALPVWIGLLGTSIWACRRHGTGLVRDLGLRVKWVDLAIGLGAGLGLRLVIGLWAIIYAKITGQTPTGNLQPILGNGLGTGVFLVLNMLAIAVISPVIEEIFFRGLGLRSALASLLRRADQPRYADPKRRVWYAAGATSLLFAGLHLSEVSDLGSAVVLVPGLFLAGWVLARLTIWSGRLGPAVVTHVVFNGVAVIALLAVQ